MMRIALSDREHARAAISAAEATAANGGVTLMPTETYYGLGARPDDAAAVSRILAMKGRPTDMALPVLVADWKQLRDLVLVPERYRAKLSRTWPAPLTVVLPLRAPLAAAPAGTLAVRIPDHELLRAVLHRIGPLTGTSANRHDAEPCAEVDQALASLLEAPDLVLDGGPTPGGGATTLVDLTGDEPALLRQGALAWNDGYPIL